MKTLGVTSSSSTGNRSKTRDYFPGCRKDSYCTCDICQASINSILDLISSTTRSKFLNPNPKPLLNSPIPFSSKKFSTPKLVKLKKIKSSPSPPLNSTARVSFRDNGNNEKTHKKGSVFGFGGLLIMVIFVVGLILGVELGFGVGVSLALRPKLSAEMVTGLSGKTLFLPDLSGKFGFLQRELRGLVSGEVSDCEVPSSH